MIENLNWLLKIALDHKRKIPKFHKNDPGNVFTILNILQSDY